MKHPRQDSAINLKYKKEKEVFERYILNKGMKFTKQRLRVLEIFLSAETHITAEELYKKLVASALDIGLATVYRTLNILSECGLAQKRQFGDDHTRYEHILNHKHHDHLICIECGKIVEFENKFIERLQDSIANRHEFIVYSHRLEIHGYCKDCYTSKNKVKG